MNFTREPIIETVITPREGCKLVIRNSKGNGQEDYFVDAVEVVSFGHSFFFRSQERPKSFLVPVSDYEVLELKETRMVLKNSPSERSLKIGGGREGAPQRREEPPQDALLTESRPAPERSEPQRAMGKRDKRRRGRRGRERHEYNQEQQSSKETREPLAPEEHQPPRAEPELRVPAEEFASGEEGKSPSFISKLFPPPSTLIKESLSRYKTMEGIQGEEVAEEKTNFEETIFDHPTQQLESEDDNEE